VREDRGAGAFDHGGVPAGVVAVLVRVQDLRDREARILRGLEAFFVVERIDREGVARFRTSDEIVEVAVVVGGPDLLDDHRSFSGGRRFDNDSVRKSVLSYAKTAGSPIPPVER
jgi:hypothetical protein